MIFGKDDFVRTCHTGEIGFAEKRVNIVFWRVQTQSLVAKQSDVAS